MNGFQKLSTLLELMLDNRLFDECLMILKYQKNKEKVNRRNCIKMSLCLTIRLHNMTDKKVEIKLLMIQYSKISTQDTEPNP